MAFKSDAHRRWWFANKDNLPTFEGKALDKPTKVGSRMSKAEWAEEMMLAKRAGRTTK